MNTENDLLLLTITNHERPIYLPPTHILIPSSDVETFLFLSFSEYLEYLPVDEDYEDLETVLRAINEHPSNPLTVTFDDAPLLCHTPHGHTIDTYEFPPLPWTSESTASFTGDESTNNSTLPT